MSRIRKKPKDDFYSDEDFEFETPPSVKRKHGRSPSSPHMGRNDNSLGVLTKKFISLIQNAGNKCIDLNEAVKTLQVQKRRIYDITNVLEGIGLIQKKHKNQIQWVGSADGSDPGLMTECSRITQELEELNREEETLDYWTSQLQNNLNSLIKDKAYSEFAYITSDDIKALPKLTDVERETLLAIMVPPGTNLEEPDPSSLPPEEKEKNQVNLYSETGEIVVYAVSNDDCKSIFD